MKFVPVPITGGPTDKQRGLFSVWDTRVQDYTEYAAANPGVDGSWKTQIYGGVPAGREPNHPVVGVSWEDAQAFCQWLTKKERSESKLPQGARYRLPSDAEWSCAAALPPEQGATPGEKSGKNDEDFVWGKEWPPAKQVGNYADETFHAKFPLNESTPLEWLKNKWLEGYSDGYATTSPVGSFPANIHGLHDMGGNVWQWCEDRWDGKSANQVLRGGSWSNHDRRTMRSSYRMGNVRDNRDNNRGFRMVIVSDK